MNDIFNQPGAGQPVPLSFQAMRLSKLLGYFSGSEEPIGKDAGQVAALDKYRDVVNLVQSLDIPVDDVSTDRVGDFGLTLTHRCKQYTFCGNRLAGWLLIRSEPFRCIMEAQKMETAVHRLRKFLDGEILTRPRKQ